MTDYFVVCHDQMLTGQVLADSIIRSIKSLKVLFVGPKAYDGRYGDKVIVCRDLKHNIEHMPKLVSYTAWHAISKNGLSQAENVCVLEYDITLSNRFEQAVEMGLSGPASAMGFATARLDTRIFLDVIPEFEDYVNKKYGGNIRMKVLKDPPTKSNFWPATSNLAMKRSFLNGFVDWYDLIIPGIAGMETLPFVHERATIVYAKLVNKSISIDLNVLKHLMKHSHGYAHD